MVWKRPVQANDVVNANEDQGKGQRALQSGQLMWSWMWETHLNPEIERRLSEGQLQAPFELVKAQLLFWVGEPLPEIRLNEEVRGTAQAVATGPLEAGQELTVADIGEVHGFILDEEDANAAHVTMLASSTGLNLMFDGRYNALVIASHVETAAEFIASANDDLRSGRLRSFAQSAFDAAELLAKAELLSLPIAEVSTSWRSAADTADRRRKRVAEKLSPIPNRAAVHQDRRHQISQALDARSARNADNPR